MRKLGLQARILFLAAAAIGAIFLLDFFTEAYIQVHNAQQRLGMQSRSVGTALVPTLQNDLVAGDLATVQQTLDSILRYGHFARLALLDAAADKVLIEGRHPDVRGKSQWDGADSDPAAPDWFAALLGFRPEPIEIPIHAGGIRYGVLLAEPSAKPLESDLWRQLGMTFLFSLAILVIALPLFILTLRSGLKPLRKLAASAQKFGDGDFSQRAPESSVREIAQTASAFNRMAENIERLLGELRASNATVRSMNETLELRVHERTAELEAANQELEAFSYSVSHDLRAPLRALDGYSHLLAEDPKSQIGKDGRHYIERIRASSQKMEHLIEDLLDLARISRHELKRIPVDLSAMANEIRELVEEQAPLRKVTWDIAPALSANGDPVLLKALLDNLLRNAWKFTSECPDARIEFAVCNAGGGKAFCVRDNGAGFDSAYADRLFKPFQRLHDAKRFEGTGIGLAIVYRILRRHGGRIWAEGSPGQGAAFYFTLP